MENTSVYTLAYVYHYVMNLLAIYNFHTMISILQLSSILLEELSLHFHDMCKFIPAKPSNPIALTSVKCPLEFYQVLSSYVGQLNGDN